MSLRVTSSLTRRYRLEEQSLIATVLWKSDNVTSRFENGEIDKRKIVNTIIAQGKQFLADYLFSRKLIEKIDSPVVYQLGGDRTETELSGEGSVSSSRQISREEIGQYEFVASKNSVVFHKPDCSSVGRISEKNLVGYKSRREAIEDGKRPCRICKP